MPIRCVCKNCQSIFYVRPFIIKNGRGIFCKKRCQYEWMSKNFVGDNNPNYNNKWTDEKKMALSISRTGSKNPQYGNVGEKCPNYGRKMSDKSKKLLSDFNKGKKLSDDIKHKISASLKGRVLSDEWREKISKTRKEKKIGYIHGTSKNPYCFKFYGKDGVRNRSLAYFDYKCIECGRSNDSNISKYGKSLSVHHVYYRKMSCCEGKEEFENCVKKVGNKLYIKEHNDVIIEHNINGDENKFAVLCSSCHTRTCNSNNRYKWILHYESKINNEYDGKSFLTKDEYKEYLKNKNINY